MTLKRHKANLEEEGAARPSCLHVGEPQKGEGEETPEEHVVRFAPGTKRAVGLTVMSPRFPLERDGHLTVTVPETVEASAGDLAPALATS